MTARKAAVLTVSDRSAEGEREDRSGPAVAAVLEEQGFDVVRVRVVPDDVDAIASAIRDLAGGAAVVATTGGTGFAPRDVTPEATARIVDRQAPGLAEAMRAAGRRSTPFADLSRGIAGTVGDTLVVNLPGSERGAVESLRAIVGLLPHAIDQLRGITDHH
ncbi:MAG: MogA/MoaB family molybdenum cofactor biosynthesis protein [Actinobacteria bacterium]|nr:MogA/MoaB family molybdenum cofactor biosynthesis protein [Actinomycetota bacterium]